MMGAREPSNTMYTTQYRTRSGLGKTSSPNVFNKLYEQRKKRNSAVDSSNQKQDEYLSPQPFDRADPELNTDEHKWKHVQEIQDAHKTHI